VLTCQPKTGGGRNCYHPQTDRRAGLFLGRAPLSLCEQTRSAPLSLPPALRHLSCASCARTPNGTPSEHGAARTQQAALPDFAISTNTTMCFNSTALRCRSGTQKYILEDLSSSVL